MSVENQRTMDVVSTTRVDVEKTRATPPERSSQGGAYEILEV